MGWTRFFRRRRWDEERALELASYLEHEIDEGLARGLTLDEARAAANRRLGNRTLIREEIYRMNTVNWAETILQDLRYAFRMLVKSPGFTLTAVLSLALGIGANTAIFSLIDAILLRWLPVSNPQELVVLGRNPSKLNPSFNYPDYLYIRDHAQSFAGVLAYSNGSRPVSVMKPEGPGSRLAGLVYVSGNYFATLGVQPAAGRLFNPADNVTEGAHAVAVLSHAYWQQEFGGRGDIIGKDILLNGSRFQVIGIAQSGFTGATVGIAPDLYLPIMMLRTLNPTNTEWNSRHQWWLAVLARMKPNVSLVQARTELDVLYTSINANDPEHTPSQNWDRDRELRERAAIAQGAQGYSFLRNDARQPLRILMFTVGLVLLIACANVASLLISRASARQKELAVRLAIGAGRGRLISQMLTESVLLSVIGGVAGIAFAWAGTRVILNYLPYGTLPTTIDLTPDWRVLGFTIGLSLLTGILFGLAPALQSSRPDLAPSLKLGSGASVRRGGRFDLRRSLVSLQVALSLLLLVTAGLFSRTLSNLRSLRPDMASQSVLMIGTNSFQRGLQPQQERQFMESLRDDAQRTPGVQSVSIAKLTPMSGSRWRTTTTIEGYQWKPNEQPSLDRNGVGPQYFETIGIPVLLGREFQESDMLPALPPRPAKEAAPAKGQDKPDLPGPPRVAIVNEAFAKRFFGGQSALGRRLCSGDKWKAERSYEIVGVVADSIYFDPRKPVEPMVYEPIYREPGTSADGLLCLRISGDAKRVAEAVRASVRRLDPAIAVTDVNSMEQNFNRSVVQERVVASLGGFFGLSALCLCAIGLYGVMAQAVTRRTREIGVRMALGAKASNVGWLILRDALAMVAAGIALGAPAAYLSAHYTESMLYGVHASDPTTMLGAALLLAAATAIAAWTPAHRATAVDPIVALRED